MANNIYNNNYVEGDDLETEDGEIDDRSSAENKRKEDEIENYYLSLNELGCDLRCSCCGDVYSDPVKLKCQHLIDRSCAVIKKNGNIIECYTCHHHTLCDDVDQLDTDFDVASRIPPKPDSLIAIINKHRGQLLKCNQEGKRNLSFIDGIDDAAIRPKKRKRKTRWDKIDNVPQTFTGAIMDILSSHNLPKNITISQFKKFTEISNKSSIMSLLTKAILQSVNVEVQKRNAKKSGPYSDTEILEMIPAHELDDLFDLEKTQFIMLYRDALDKGVILPPSNTKCSKLPLLPTPKSLSNKAIKSSNNLSPECHRKCSTSDSSDSDFSDNNSLVNCKVSNKCQNLDLPNLNPKLEKNVTEVLIPPILKLKEEEIVTLQEDPNSKDINGCKTIPETNGITEDSNENVPSGNPVSSDSHSSDENTRYRDSVNRLHSIYSSMYHASLKMKELENQLQSTDYQSAYKTYSEKYSEYQTLYSSLQPAISIDSVVTEKSDSVSIGNSSDNKNTTVSKLNTMIQVGNNSSDSIAMIPTNNALQHNKLSSIGNCTEKLSPLDSTNVISDSKLEIGTDSQLLNNSILGSAVPQDLQQYRKQIQMNNRNKFGYLWISNLCKETRTNDLCKLFGQFGHVSKIKLFQYKADKPMTFFSLIFMPNFAEAETAYRELQNTLLFDKLIHIKMLCPPIEAL